MASSTMLPQEPGVDLILVLESFKTSPVMSDAGRFIVYTETGLLGTYVQTRHLPPTMIFYTEQFLLRGIT